MYNLRKQEPLQLCDEWQEGKERLLMAKYGYPPKASTGGSTKLPVKQLGTGGSKKSGGMKY